MQETHEQLWVMIAGPYKSGAASAADQLRNLEALNEAAVAVFDKGHLPVIGVNLAKPIIDAAGAERYEELMMPISLALAERCDAVLRIGGPSRGADDEVERIKARGGDVYYKVSELP